MCVVFALAYGAIGLSGLLVGHDATLAIIPGLIEFHAGDYGVHFATGLLFLGLASLKRSDEKSKAV